MLYFLFTQLTFLEMLVCEPYVSVSIFVLVSSREYLVFLVQVALDVQRHVVAQQFSFFQMQWMSKYFSLRYWVYVQRC